MFGNNKYLVSFVIIIALVLFSFMVYKIIKFNETIKDINAEKASLEKTIASRDFTIKQFKTKQTKNQDDDGDYCKGTAPIEVFDNKASEMNPVCKPKAVQKHPTHTSDGRKILLRKGATPIKIGPLPDQSDLHTPSITAKTQCIIDAVTGIATQQQKSPIMNLSDEQVIECASSDGLMNEIDEESSSTASIIDNIIGNTNFDDIIEDGDGNDLSDAMYIVKEDNRDEDEEDDEEDEEDEGEDEGVEYEYYDDEGNLLENNGEEYEYYDEEDVEDNEEEENEENEEEENEDEDNEDEEDNKEEDDEDNDEDIKAMIEANIDEDEDEDDEIFVDEEFESEDDTDDERRLQMEAMTHAEVKRIAKELKIRLTAAGKHLSKSMLIDKILLV